MTGWGGGGAVSCLIHTQGAVKGTVSQDFLLQVFSLITFPKAPDNNIRINSNFFGNSRRYSQVKVHHQCQRHRWQICHPGVNDTGGILLPVSKTLAANLPPVSTTPAANITTGGKLPLVSRTPAANLPIEGSSVRLGYSRNIPHSVLQCLCLGLVAGLLRPRLSF
jgi:hypothetical protein